MNRKQHLLHEIFILLAAAFILMLFALYNGFPFVNSDVGTYISSGFTNKAPDDRTIFYGWFIRIFSFGQSVWLVLLAQSLLLAYVCRRIIRHFIPRLEAITFLAIMLLLSLTTMAGWFNAHLMPDIFTSIMVLALYLLVFDKQERRSWLLMLIVLISILVHSSNLLILIIALVLYWGTQFFQKQIRRYRPLVLKLLLVVVLAWNAICASNYFSGNSYRLSTSTHVFVMGKLAESGVLQTYLKKNCGLKQYNICNYIDSIPAVAWEFHFNGNSPVQLAGGWEATKEEYNRIIAHLFSKPQYYPFMAYKLAEATARQLCLYHIDGSFNLPWVRYDETTTPFQEVAKHFPHELNQLKAAKQNHHVLDIVFYDRVFVILFISSFMLFAFAVPAKEQVKWKHALLFLLLFIIINAMVTAGLSSVNARFNSRVIWILVLPIWISIIKSILFVKLNNHKHV